MFGGAFGGPTLWENQAFVSPNEVRSMERQKKGDKYSGRLANQQKRKARREESAPGPDPLGDVFAGS
jgi:ribosome biogenesis protein BRX1